MLPTLERAPLTNVVSVTPDALNNVPAGVRDPSIQGETEKFALRFRKAG